MSTPKEPGIRARLRAEKATLRQTIADLQQQIAAALKAPRVPARILAGDATVAAQWKDEIAKQGGNLYHLHNPPSERLTVPQLVAVVGRLQALKASLT